MEDPFACRDGRHAHLPRLLDEQLVVLQKHAMSRVRVDARPDVGQALPAGTHRDAVLTATVRSIENPIDQG